MDLTLCKLRNEFYLKFVSVAERKCADVIRCLAWSEGLTELLSDQSSAGRNGRGYKLSWVIIESMHFSFIDSIN